MSSPMGFGGMGGFGGGKGGGFGSPYGSPYGMSQQYMPNAGLMSGYSTGFGPYGGFQRPRFGGGKGGRNRPMPYPMGGGKGGGYGGGYNDDGPFTSQFPGPTPSAKPTFDQNLQFILDQVAAGTATPGQQKFYDERYLTGEYLNNPNNFATGGGSAGFVADSGPDPTITPFREQLGTPYFSGRQFGGFRDIPVGGLDDPISYSPRFGFYSGPYNDEFFRRGGVMTAV